MTPTTSTRTEAEYQNRKEPESLRLQAVAPVITASDVGASIAWYRDVMGFVVGEEWKNDDGVVQGAVMRAGAVDFNLTQDDFAKGRDRSKGVGFRLYCRTGQDVDKLAEDIKSRGGTLDQQPTDQPWGSRDFAVTDPDGFKISVGSQA